MLFGHVILLVKLTNDKTMNKWEENSLKNNVQK